MNSKKKLLYSFMFVLSILIILLPVLFRTRFEEFKTLGLIGIFIVNFLGSATIFLPTPSILSVGIGGNLYNPFAVAIFASFGSSLGESVGYLFGHSSKEVLNLKKHKILYYLNDYIFKRYGTLAILVFSFIPNPFFDGIGILVGMSSFSLKKFVAIVFVGRFFRNLLIAYLGAKL